MLCPDRRPARCVHLALGYGKAGRGTLGWRQGARAEDRVLAGRARCGPHIARDEIAWRGRTRIIYDARYTIVVGPVAAARVVRVQPVVAARAAALRRRRRRRRRRHVGRRRRRARPAARGALDLGGGGVRLLLRVEHALDDPAAARLADPDRVRAELEDVDVLKRATEGGSGRKAGARAAGGGAAAAAAVVAAVVVVVGMSGRWWWCATRQPRCSTPHWYSRASTSNW